MQLTFWKIIYFVNLQWFSVVLKLQCFYVNTGFKVYWNLISQILKTHFYLLDSFLLDIQLGLSGDLNFVCFTVMLLLDVQYSTPLKSNALVFTKTFCNILKDQFS